MTLDGMSMLLAMGAAEPPVTPPPDCIDHFLWQIAFDLYRPHGPAVDSPCLDCSAGITCPGRVLAVHGLLTACGYRTVMSDYWIELARIRRMNIGGLPTVITGAGPERRARVVPPGGCA
jgi:hypothetical protein